MYEESDKKIFLLFIVFSVFLETNVNIIVFANSIQNTNNILTNSKKEFKNVQDNFVEKTPRISGTLITGSYFIPGLGEVIITVTGVVIVAGVVVKVGSKTYNKVIKWLNEKEADEAKKKTKDKIDKVLKGKRKIKESSNTIYEGTGGNNGAKKDFNKLEPKNKKTYPNGTVVGELPDGTKVNLRKHSSDGRTTIEIQGKWKIKIRYNR